MSIAQLMHLKLFLNKILKADNIEYYPLNALIDLRKAYEEFLKNSEGTDPDFPLINFGGNSNSGGENYTKSNNKQQNLDLLEENKLFSEIPFPENKE